MLAFAEHPDVDLWLHRSGCEELSNGHIRTDAGEFVALEEATLHPSKASTTHP